MCPLFFPDDFAHDHGAKLERQFVNAVVLLEPTSFFVKQQQPAAEGIEIRSFLKKLEQDFL